jgi:RNA polymerase sigma-70 factor (ECF subfamily)
MDDLVRGLQAGDPAAFDRLVRDYGDRLYRFVRRMVGERWADDVAQEVLVRVHRSVGAYAPTGSFDSWLFTIANNLCIDHLRRNRPERRESPLSQLDAGGEGEPERFTDRREAGPVEAMEDREMKEALRRAVANLPCDQRQVFVMREEAGLPFKEIARIVGCPLNTALGRMHYAMENLKKAMKAYRE